MDFTVGHKFDDCIKTIEQEEWCQNYISDDDCDFEELEDGIIGVQLNLECNKCPFYIEEINQCVLGSEFTEDMYLVFRTTQDLRNLRSLEIDLKIGKEDLHIAFLELLKKYNNTLFISETNSMLKLFEFIEELSLDDKTIYYRPKDLNSYNFHLFQTHSYNFERISELSVATLASLYFDQKISLDCARFVLYLLTDIRIELQSIQHKLLGIERESEVMINYIENINKIKKEYKEQQLNGKQN